MMWLLACCGHPHRRNDMQGYADLMDKIEDTVSDQSSNIAPGLDLLHQKHTDKSKGKGKGKGKNKGKGNHKSGGKNKHKHKQEGKNEHKKQNMVEFVNPMAISADEEQSPTDLD
jgi:hypothetical protein